MLMKNNIVALLPMKANSERVKGKNFKKFIDKPLFKWILDTLLSVSLIDKVIINTDARFILEENNLFENDRIIIRDRKLDLIGDFVSMNEIIKDDINNINSNLYLMTHTTNPFLSKTTINNSILTYNKLFKNNEIDSLFTVDKIQNRLYQFDGTPINHDPVNLIRTQDLIPWYQENSNLYLFSKNSFNSTKARIGLKPFLYETPKFESIDIDDENDWNFAEIVAQYLKNI
jgi:CMP-N-acetylneuraminic acid synthetase